MSAIPATPLTPAMRAGVARFEALVEAIGEQRDDDGGDLLHAEVRELVREAVIQETTPEERSGFLIALAEYLGIVVDGAVPDAGYVAWCLERGEFTDPPAHRAPQ